jgi:hypothetical protein
MLLLAGAPLAAAVAQEPSAPSCSAKSDENCACVLDVPPTGEPIAHLSEMRGDILISGVPGLSSQGTGVAMLMLGDNVVVPNQGSARLTAPHCDRRLPGMSSLVIRPQDGCACASLVTTRPNPVVQTTPAGSGGAMAAAGLAGAAALGGAVYLLTQGGGDSVSP